MGRLQRTALAVGFAVAITAQAVEPNPIVRQAQKLYREGDYRAAARLLERGLASGINDTDTRNEARLCLASAYFAMGDRDGANRELLQLFNDAPGLKIHDELFSPPFLEAVDRARAAPRLESPPPKLAPVIGIPTGLPAPPEKKAAPRRFAWLPLVGGVAGIGVGTYFLVQARADHFSLVGQLSGPTDMLSASASSRIASAGNAEQLAGWIVMTTGLALLFTAGALFLFGGEAP